MATATTPQKSQTQKPAKPAKPAAAPRVLLNYLEHAPSAILSPEGLINVPNPNEHGFDPNKHERLSRKDFSSDVNWLTYKAGDLRRRAATMLKTAERFEREAATGAKFGDPAKRAKVKKIQRMAAALDDLRKQLAAEGVDIDSLMGETA